MIKISCSNLFRYFICPAALTHEQEWVIKEKTKYAEEGTAKHLEMQEAIEGIGTELERSSAANELKEAFLQIEPTFSFNACICEEKIEKSIVQLNGVVYTLVGKPDLIYISVETLTIYIVDYKFGYIQVDVNNNSQLLGYADLATEQYNLGDFTIKVGIFQDGLLRVTEISDEELSEFHFNLWKLIDDSQEHKYHPSVAACKWCDYREKCPALLNTVSESVKKITDTNLQELSEPAMFEFRKSMMLNKKLIEFVLEDSENFFKKSLARGAFFDFCSLKSNGALQAWTTDLNEDEIAAELSNLSNRDKSDFYEKKLKSVNQIKKLVEVPANLVITKDKAKSLKIKEENALKTATDELF
jgi:hypothetical protein